MTTELNKKLKDLEDKLAAETAAREHAEKLLKKSEFFLKKSQEIGAIGSFVLNIPGDNPSAQTWESTSEMDRTFAIDENYPRTGESWLGLIVQKDEVAEYFSHQVFKAQRLFKKEYQIIRPCDGKKIWISGRGELEFDDHGNCIRMVGTVQDITERKARNEEKKKMQELLFQAKKMESIGILAGGVAHDFNNLLTAILGNVELALMSLDSSNALYPNFIAIEKSAKYAAKLTHQLLSYSRKQIIAPREMNLNSVIEELKKTLERLTRDNITLRTVTQPEVHPIKVDPSQIHQIIINLVTNARDAMPDGGILTIETASVCLDETHCLLHSHDQTGPHAMLSVTDTGSGVDNEVLSNIFEPFFTTKGLGQATGLGLSTVYGAVKQNGGALDVTSEIGKGTCFRVFFPACFT
jgi:signal transduction histidine kinase